MYQKDGMYGWDAFKDQLKDEIIQDMQGLVCLFNEPGRADVRFISSRSFSYRQHIAIFDLSPKCRLKLHMLRSTCATHLAKSSSTKSWFLSVVVLIVVTGNLYGNPVIGSPRLNHSQYVFCMNIMNSKSGFVPSGNIICPNRFCNPIGS